jgi:hypothetical protein
MTDVQKVKLDLNYYVKDYVIIVGTYLTFALIVIIKNRKLNKIYEIFSDKLSIFVLLIMMGYIIYAFKFSENEKFRKAILDGLTAFIIAICAKVDLIFIPFFIVFNLKYYIDV